MGWSSSSGGGAAPTVVAPKRVVIADRCSNYGRSDGGYTGADAGHTYRSVHKIAGNTLDISLVYGNFQQGEFEEVPMSADITVKATIEFGAILIPITFAGKTSVVINPGGLVESDALALRFAKNDVIYIRTYVSSAATSGQKWPRGNSLFTVSGEGYWTSDQTGVTGVSGMLDVIPGYVPMAIVGRTQAPIPAIAFVGDSITWGNGDNDQPRPYGDDVGFAIRAMRTSGQANLRIARGSERVRDVVILGRKSRSMTLLKYCTHVVSEYGINDVQAGPFRTVSEIQTDLLSLWNWVKDMGIPIYQCTLTPVSSSTDGWSTTANQTTHSTNSVRTAINNWIRTRPAPLTGFFDTADMMESARNAGIWKAGYSGDGVHPNQTGHTTMATAIDTTKFTV